MKLNLRQRTISKIGRNKLAKILPSADTPPLPLFLDLGFIIATGINSTMNNGYDITLFQATVTDCTSWTNVHLRALQRFSFNTVA